MLYYVNYSVALPFASLQDKIDEYLWHLFDWHGGGQKDMIIISMGWVLPY